MFTYLQAMFFLPQTYFFCLFSDLQIDFCFVAVCSHRLIRYAAAALFLFALSGCANCFNI